MKSARLAAGSAALLLLATGISARAVSITGTVTDKTTGRPSSGDTVVLVDVQAGMNEAATATTNSTGQYSLDTPGMGPYLIRVTHQGGSYFIAAPQGGAPGNVNVYDVAAKVDGVSIDADMLLLEAAGGVLRVHERFLVRNTSLPPRAQFSDNTFEVALPLDAEIDGASATRPGGLGTNTHLLPLAGKGHYTFNVPIQPDQDEKETLFEVQYHLPYNGKYTFRPQVQMPADNLVVYAAKGIDFGSAQGASFQPALQDPRVQTFVAKNVRPGQAISFSISGEGQMPPDAQSSGMGQPASMGGGGDSGGTAPAAGPGGGLGAPIGAPDPLTKYKWWILAFLTLLLVAASGFLLRRRQGALAGLPAAHQSLSNIHLPDSLPIALPRATHSPVAMHGNSSDAILQLLKDEMFAIEREKLSGTLSMDQYATVKVGLEALLRRVLERQQKPEGGN